MKSDALKNITFGLRIAIEKRIIIKTKK